jgi:hypothetical protein
MLDVFSLKCAAMVAPAGVVIGDDSEDPAKSRSGSSGISSGLRLENVSRQSTLQVAGEWTK